MRKLAPPEFSHLYAAHPKTRRPIESAWGLYKSRFQCARRRMKTKKPANSCKILKACAILHNFFILVNDRWTMDEEIPYDINDLGPIIPDTNNNRLSIVNNAFIRINNL